MARPLPLHARRPQASRRVLLAELLTRLAPRQQIVQLLLRELHWKNLLHLHPPFQDSHRLNVYRQGPQRLQLAAGDLRASLRDVVA